MPSSDRCVGYLSLAQILKKKCVASAVVTILIIKLQCSTAFKDPYVDAIATNMKAELPSLHVPTNLVCLLCGTAEGVAGQQGGVFCANQRQGGER